VRWPSGTIDTLKNPPVNRLLHVKEGAGIVQTVDLRAPSNPTRR